MYTRTTGVHESVAAKRGTSNRNVRSSDKRARQFPRFSSLSASHQLCPQRQLALELRHPATPLPERCSNGNTPSQLSRPWGPDSGTCTAVLRGCPPTFAAPSLAHRLPSRPKRYALAHPLVLLFMSLSVHVPTLSYMYILPHQSTIAECCPKVMMMCWYTGWSAESQCQCVLHDSDGQASATCQLYYANATQTNVRTSVA